MELTEKAGSDRLECPACEDKRERRDLGPLILPKPTKRELVAALLSSPDDPWWEVRLIHGGRYRDRDRKPSRASVVRDGVLGDLPDGVVWVGQ